MIRRALSSSGASKIPIPVLTDPSVGPARMSTPPSAVSTRRNARQMTKRERQIEL